MSSLKPQATKDKLTRIYGLGIVAFSVIFGFITLFGIFLKYLKLD